MGLADCCIKMSPCYTLGGLSYFHANSTSQIFNKALLQVMHIPESKHRGPVSTRGAGGSCRFGILCSSALRRS